ncbi:MAG: hypothetical protein HRU20_14760 [Pseudomonadales bacterium]|nr:hypothetical protein [Pseudomonadales bacterium]
MFYFISLMIIWLLCEKTLALITVCHMSNVPPLSPIVIKDPQMAKNTPSKRLPPVELSEWDKFELIRHSLKQGLSDFGISENTGKITKLLFQASRACQYLAIAMTGLLLFKTLATL